MSYFRMSRSLMAGAAWHRLGAPFDRALPSSDVNIKIGVLNDSPASMPT
jgi:hypothetical protein